MIESKERRLKEQLVIKVHVTKDGSKRKIEYKESKKLWMTIMPDKRKVYGKTREGLIDKLFIAYGLSIHDYCFGNIFELAIEEKAKTQNRNPETISHDRSDYKRYISKSLANKDIREITKFDLREYTQNFVNDKNPSKKCFFAYKGILNMVFEYAIEHEIISVNPVLGINNRNYYSSCNTVAPKAEEKIFSENEIATVIDTVRKSMSMDRYKGYFINGYAILLAIETGMRAGELFSLKWDDIYEDRIHIHSQQLSIKKNTNNIPSYVYSNHYSVSRGKIYYYVPWTKDEKGVAQGGRFFPKTTKIRLLLDELKELQNSRGIDSEFVFCHEDGEWVKTDAYETCLRRMLQRLGFRVTNNHAFRMSLNSNILIEKLNLSSVERAKYLGHSPETNEKYYSFANKDNIRVIGAMLDELDDTSNEVSLRSHQNVIDFDKRKKPEFNKFKALI